jgi:hypothetical protein
MNSTIVYLFQRFFYRVFEFLRHWYVKSLFIYSHNVINFLERLDKNFAFKITLRHLFQPLYKDYSIIGYVLGFIFRTGRIIGASFIYVVLIAAAILIYVIWLAVPIFIVYKILA